MEQSLAFPTQESTALAIPEAKTAEQKTALQEYIGLNEWKEVGEQVRRGQEITVTDAGQSELIAEARAVRIKLKNARVAIENKRKQLKASVTVQAEAIDGMAKALKEIIEPVEDRLAAQEKFAEIQEEKRLSELEAVREAELGKYLDDVSFYDLRSMSEQGYAQLLASSKIAHENRIAAEKKAEDDRIAKEKADAAENERIKAENERLKKENDEKEKKLAKEKEDREKAEAAAKRLKDEQDRKDKEARERKEAKEKADKLAADRARRAPDKVKIEALAAAISDIPMPDVKSEEAKAVITEVIERLAEVATLVKQKALLL